MLTDRIEDYREAIKADRIASGKVEQQGGALSLTEGEGRGR